MSRSTDPGHFFQTDTSQEEIARRAVKSRNTAGNPTKLSSKLLAIAADPDDAGRVHEDEQELIASVQTGDKSCVFTGPAAPVTCVAVTSRKARILFAGCWDKSIWSWSVSSRAPLRKYVGHSDFVKTLLCITVDSKDLLISGGADAVIMVWDVDTGRKLHTLKGHTRGVQDLALDPLSYPDYGSSPKALIVFSAGSDREIRRWSIAADSAQEIGDPIQEHPGPPEPIVQHETSVYKLYFDTDADLWTASADNTAKHLVRDRAWSEDTSLEHPDFVRDVVVDARRGWIITACRDEEVRVWDGGTGKLHHTYTGHFEEVTGLLLVGTIVVSVSIDATIRQWSLAPEELRKAKEEAGKVRDGGEEPVKPPVRKSLLTTEEEAELAELMDDGE
ncbi:hypothetical protein LTR16_003926 [Cryomyces antarcticus]|uniref:Anaphase-promoting complex subunit 4 WD40 domain-containing protein n=1 Tax=Cryomyces antarcticus TaxID=329879 RepID=A0ABR0LNM4_9PEZI|nr:hypothetical protein LTR16_003926 [Cryomyces antarcticus]